MKQLPRTKEHHEKPINLTSVILNGPSSDELHRCLTLLATQTNTTPPPEQLLLLNGQYPNRGTLPETALHAALFHDIAPGSLAGAIFSPDNVLFPNAWNHSFIARILTRLKAGAPLILPLCPPTKAHKLGFWNIDWLIRCFGHPDAQLDGAVVYHGFEAPLPRNSVLTWYWEMLDRGIGDRAENYLSGYQQRIEKFVDSGHVVIPDNTRSIQESQFSEFLAPAVFDQTKFHDYFDYNLNSVGTRAHLVGNLLAPLKKQGEPLRILDGGGGAGFICMELLLSDPDIEQAINVDSSYYNLVPATHALNHFIPQLDHRWQMNMSSMEDFTYDGSYHAVTFMRSLFSVDRDRARIMLSRVWEALIPGGLLIVLEIIGTGKHATAAGELFSAPSLDCLLQEFGEVEYFHSRAAIYLTKHEAGEKSVFRVVRKADSKSRWSLFGLLRPQKD